jgi:hypothetical protein
MYDETAGKTVQTNLVSLFKHYIDNYLSEEVKIMHLVSASFAGTKKKLLMAQF